MATSHVISTLVNKCAEIEGDILTCQETIKKLKENLNVIRKSIIIFDPNYNLKEIKPRKSQSRYFKHGEISKKIIECVKIQKQSNADDIIKFLFKDSDKSELFIKSFRNNIYVALSKLAKRDILVAEKIKGVKTYSINTGNDV